MESEWRWEWIWEEEEIAKGNLYSILRLERGPL